MLAQAEDYDQVRAVSDYYAVSLTSVLELELFVELVASGFLRILQFLAFSVWFMVSVKKQAKMNVMGTLSKLRLVLPLCITWMNIVIHGFCISVLPHEHV